MTTYEDPLRLCPVENWSELEDVFRDDWPRSISTVIFLQMQRYMLQCGLDHGCKVYCPYGNRKYGIVAVNTKKGLNEVIVQCPGEDTSKLEDALKITNIVDWEKEIEIPFAPKHVINCIERVIENKCIGIHFIPATTYALDKSSSLFNVQLPPGFTFDLLSLKYIDLLDSTWPHRFDGCKFYFELIIKAKLGYGLFRQKQLVSWALVRETGCLLHLFTLRNERRKGYGELVLKLISNVLLKDGKYVVAYCKKDNINAARLYQKLNFEHIRRPCMHAGRRGRAVRVRSGRGGPSGPAPSPVGDLQLRDDPNERGRSHRGRAMARQERPGPRSIDELEYRDVVELPT